HFIRKPFGGNASAGSCCSPSHTTPSTVWRADILYNFDQSSDVSGLNSAGSGLRLHRPLCSASKNARVIAWFNERSSLINPLSVPDRENAAAMPRHLSQPHLFLPHSYR